MTTLNIEGRRVTVDDGFLQLSPEQQHNTVEEIASSFAPKPDKYQQAAIDEQDQLAADGRDEGAGFTRRLVHGATLGADSTIMAGLTTPLEMLKRGVGPGEGYNYAKAREDRIMGDARANTGALGTVAELAGGGIAGAGLAGGGVTAARMLTPNAGLISRALASAADGTALGGVAGFNEGNGLQERATNAIQGGALGGALGGAFPVASAITRGVTSPIISNLRALHDPEAFARSQVARAISESGRSTADIAGDVGRAAAEGQPQFNIADAMGNSGQRMLSTVARAPGEGRTAVVNALEARQGDQGRRISNALSEGFDAPQTAAQTERRLVDARTLAANTEYGAVRADAKPVDLSAAIAHADDMLTPGVNQIAYLGSNIANDSIEQAVSRFRSMMTDGRSNLTDFPAVQRMRFELSDAATTAGQNGQGNKARILGGLLRHVDAAMENASAGHLAANRNFAQASRDIEAVQTGRDAAMRGRTEDVIPSFEALTPQGQQAFLSGYADPHIASTQAAAFGVNKARPLTSSAFQDEAAAVAPGNDLMQRRIGREQTMFETRGQALGGSKTADNLADADAGGIDPTVLGHVFSGNYGGAVKAAIQAGSSALNGNTPAVRQEIANILLQRGANVTPASLDQMAGETLRRLEFVQTLARNVGRGASGAIAIAPNTQRKRNVGTR